MPQINIKVTEQEKQRLMHTAKSQGLNLSTWLRSLGIQECNKSDKKHPLTAFEPKVRETAKEVRTREKEKVRQFWETRGTKDNPF